MLVNDCDTVGVPDTTDSDAVPDGVRVVVPMPDGDEETVSVGGTDSDAGTPVVPVRISCIG